MTRKQFENLSPANLKRVLPLVGQWKGRLFPEARRNSTIALSAVDPLMQPSKYFPEYPSELPELLPARPPDEPPDWGRPPDEPPDWGRPPEDPACLGRPLAGHLMNRLTGVDRLKTYLPEQTTCRPPDELPDL